MLVPGYVLPAHLPTEETETPLATSALGSLPGSSAPPPDHELCTCASSPRSAQDMLAPPQPPLLMEPPRSLAAPVLCLPGDWGLWEQPAPQQQQLLQPAGLWAWPPPFLPSLLPRVFKNNVCVCKSCQWACVGSAARARQDCPRGCSLEDSDAPRHFWWHPSLLLEMTRDQGVGRTLRVGSGCWRGCPLGMRMLQIHGEIWRSAATVLVVPPHQDVICPECPCSTRMCSPSGC